jgi:hypothetical protein
LVEPERDQQVERLLAQRGEDHVVQAGGAVKHRAQAHKDRGTVG